MIVSGLVTIASTLFLIGQAINFQRYEPEKADNTVSVNSSLASLPGPKGGPTELKEHAKAVDPAKPRKSAVDEKDKWGR